MKKFFPFHLLFFLSVLLLIGGCKKKEVPSLLTKDITEISESSATCGGVITNDGNGAISAKGVCWSKDPDPTTSDNKTVDGTGTEEFSSSLKSLDPNTTYYVKAYAINKNGTGYGEEVTFKTLGNVPVAVTQAATEVTENSARLNGKVNPNSLSTSVIFEYGTTTAYGQTVTIQNPVTGISDSNVNSVLTGLNPKTTYHFRIKAENSLGIVYGSDLTFKTLGEVPAAVTKVATNITENSAALNGTVNPNRLSSTVKFEYGLTNSYGNTIDAGQSPLTGTTDQNVTVTISGLNPNTTYHFRVKAENSLGITYGSDFVFSTLPLVTDIDGFTYEIVAIGNQVWLKQNLKTTRYRDGSVIPLVSSGSAWSGLTSGAYCSYDNENANVSTYGALYNWYAITDPRGLCPSGWHVPTNDEWTTLTTYLGGLEVAGGKMKETGTLHWLSPNTGADNSSGFKAIGAGFRDRTAAYSEFKQVEYFWSSSEYSPTHGIARKLFYDFSSVSFAGNYKESGFSVRCIKD